MENINHRMDLFSLVITLVCGVLVQFSFIETELSGAMVVISCSQPRESPMAVIPGGQPWWSRASLGVTHGGHSGWSPLMVTTSAYYR
jgi:hypothetical protein